MDYDTNVVIASFLKLLGYRELASFLYRNKENKRFVDSCVGLIIHKTPAESREYVKECLFVSGALGSI